MFHSFNITCFFVSFMLLMMNEQGIKQDLHSYCFKTTKKGKSTVDDYSYWSMYNLWGLKVYAVFLFNLKRPSLPKCLWQWVKNGIGSYNIFSPCECVLFYFSYFSYMLFIDYPWYLYNLSQIYYCTHFLKVFKTQSRNYHVCPKVGEFPRQQSSQESHWFCLEMTGGTSWTLTLATVSIIPFSFMQSLWSLNYSVIFGEQSSHKLFIVSLWIILLTISRNLNPLDPLSQVLFSKQIANHVKREPLCAKSGQMLKVNWI